MNNLSNNIHTTFLKGGGELGELIRNFDWTQTPVGAPAQWPHSLLNTVSIILHSRFPMFLWWGEDLIQFYNDAYRPSLGNRGKHPLALGQKGVDCWPEIWPTIYPLINQVLTTGEGTWHEDRLIPIYRNGQLEDVYWTFSYSAVRGDAGSIDGVLVTCTETTEKVCNLKRLEESRQNLRFAIDAAELGTWDYNPATHMFSGNERLKAMFGLGDEPEIDISVAIEAIAEKDRNRVTAAIQRALDYNTRSDYDIEYSIFNKITNAEMVVRAKGITSFDEQKKAYRFNGTLQDVTEQARARRRIEESEHRIRTIVENAPFPIGVYEGKEMRITFANQSIIDVWGKGQEVIGKLYAEILPELENQKVFEQLDSVYTTGIPFYADNQQIDLFIDGKLHPFFFNYRFTPLYNSSGEIYGVMNTAADVTALVNAKLKVEQNEKHIRNMIVQAPVAMCILRGPEYVVEIANNLMFDLWGKKPAEILNKPLFKGLPEAGGQGLEPILWNVYHKGERFVANERSFDLPRNGKLEQVFVNFVYEPMPEMDGFKSGIFAVAVDVTPQVNARRKIEEAEARARLAIKSAELGVYEIDLKNDAVVTDARFQEIFGFNSQVTRTEFANAIHPDDLAVRQQAHQAAILSGTLEYEVRIIKKDKSINWIRAKGKLFYDENKEPERIIGVVQDITEQKIFSDALEHKVQERTRELAEANLKLQQTNVELNQFAYIASHDLQEPLRKVRTFTDLIQVASAGLNERTTSYLQKIQDSAIRMQTLINDVLKFSQLSKEREKFELVDLNSVLSKVLEDYDLLIEQKSALIETSGLPEVEAIPLQMTQLFTNLISNALKFSSESRRLLIAVTARQLTPGEVSLHNELEHGMLHYEIVFRDNGIGFSQENSNQIFTIFQRLHGKSEYTGTGIGLAMCKKIVMNHRGTIYATSEPDKGASFVVILPQLRTA